LFHVVKVANKRLKSKLEKRIEVLQRLSILTPFFRILVKRGM
jgi:hypothetical protein